MLQESKGTSADPKFNRSLPGYEREKEPASGIPWIGTVKGVPYFVDDQGDDWTPVGQNDAITWPDLAGIFRRRNPAGVEAYLGMLARNGVTCLRLMLEYCQGEHRYLERPAGHFQPNMVRLWDDVFALCEAYGLRILLTPYDTFWMWLRWSHHPYQRGRGGPCARRSQWLLCRETRAAIKNRLAFATERWGGSGALFAWDIWNEIHPAHAEDSADCFAEFVGDVSDFLRKKELHLHGRAHPQTVSVFTPALDRDGLVADCVFRHPSLDFASTHFYESGTIDHPSNTVAPALSTGRLAREALAEIKDQRPFFDSEHGPIHTFKDHRKTLPEPFDDEYFRHMQWAHFASGGAGGGMRWPNRHPHALTKGMRAAQSALARFLPLIRWQHFRRRNLNDEVGLSDPALAAFACGDGEQVVAWLLRTDEVGRDGTLRKDVEPRPVRLDVPALKPGRYRVTTWDTVAGVAASAFEVDHPQGGRLHVPVLQVRTDLALSISRLAA